MLDIDAVLDSLTLEEKAPLVSGGVNIRRSPRCGRNFKHVAAINQEDDRLRVSSSPDRT